MTSRVAILLGVFFAATNSFAWQKMEHEKSEVNIFPVNFARTIWNFKKQEYQVEEIKYRCRKHGAIEKIMALRGHDSRKVYCGLCYEDFIDKKINEAVPVE